MKNVFGNTNQEWLHCQINIMKQMSGNKFQTFKISFSYFAVSTGVNKQRKPIIVVINADHVTCTTTTAYTPAPAHNRVTQGDQILHIKNVVVTISIPIC